MVFANLVHRPLRSAISIVAIAVEVTLILLIVGLSMGIMNDSAERQKGIGADVMVSPPGSSFMIGVNSAPVSIKVADRLRTLPHVVAVSPVVTQLVTSGAVEVISGIDLDPKSPNNFNLMGMPFVFLKGGPFQGANDMIVDDFYAAQKHAKVGDKIELLNQTFRICGIVEHGKGARRYLPMTTLQDLVGAQGKASMFYMKLDDPKNADLVVSEIHQVPGMEKYNARSLAEYLSLMTVNNMPGFGSFINVVIGISVIIGFIVIFQSMYTAVMERTREIGILKSLGANKFYIVNVVLRETLVLALAGIIVGILFSAAGRIAIIHKFQMIRVMWDLHWVLRAAGIAVVGALLGALYPAYKAAQKDPIDALAYE